MDAFLDTITSFPTVIYTIFLGVVVVYWALVIAGALEIELLHGADVDADVDADLGGEAGPLHGLLEALGVGAIPITIVGSFWVLLAWLTSVVALDALGEAGRSGVARAAVFVVAGVIGLLATIALLRPFRRLVVRGRRAVPRHRGLVGAICEVTTGRVDDRFGQARIEQGGNVFEVQVRCLEPNALGRGDRALVIDYDEEEGVHVVAPLDQVLAEADRRLLDR